MLERIKIQNVALVPQVEIEFGEKFNVLSGETGAGKSIILGSFGFILGDKISKNVIRTDAAFAKVDAVFRVSTDVAARVEDLCGSMCEDGLVVISRTVKVDGRGECRVNGDVVTAGGLRDVASLLINIHGQHEAAALLKPRCHIDILDEFGCKDSGFKTTLEAYRREYATLGGLRGGLKQFGGDESERVRLIDMYQYQIGEIESAGLREGEDEELSERKQVMQNFDKIRRGVDGAAGAFAEGGVSDTVGRVVSGLGAVSHLDARLEGIYDKAKALAMEAEDLGDVLSEYLDDMEFDEDEFAQVDARLEVIKGLKKKYGGSVAEVLAFLEAARDKLAFLTKSEADIERVKAEIAAQEVVVEKAAAQLRSQREEKGAVLCERVAGHLRELGMPACRIGFDEDFAFMFSANAGEPMRALSSVISGGEMSRFMLALKAVASSEWEVRSEKWEVGTQGSGVTLVFDEIDSGISGDMGVAVASKIAAISKTHQVIVVTHLPSVAARADTHFLISKAVEGGKTLTGVAPLDTDGMVAELARMIGGDRESAMAHARTMKNG